MELKCALFRILSVAVLRVMSKLQGAGLVPGSSVVGRKEEEWSGKAEQLFQQQLKNVQEECRYDIDNCVAVCITAVSVNQCSMSHRRLREAHRHGDGSGSQLSLSSQVCAVTHQPS